MDAIKTLGIDTSKNTFTLCGENERGDVILKKNVKRNNFLNTLANIPQCLIAIEACGGSHHWGREILKLGHEIKIIPPQYAAQHRKGNKNDFNDARSIIRAAHDPQIIPVDIKSIPDQAIQTLHRIRSRHVKNQVAIVNELRAILSEFGIAIREGIAYAKKEIPVIIRDIKTSIPGILKAPLADLHSELLNTVDAIERINVQLKEIASQSDCCLRIQKVEGIGLISSTAIIAEAPDANNFKNGRQFAAWMGLTPRHVQTGGKEGKPKILGISKKGNSYIRSLLVQGAMSVVISVNKKKKKLINFEKDKVGTSPSLSNREKWLIRLIEDKGVQKAAVAFANKNARIIWALLSSGQQYKPQGI